LFGARSTGWAWNFSGAKREAMNDLLPSDNEVPIALIVITAAILLLIIFAVADVGTFWHSWFRRTGDIISAGTIE
jgi:hypothetical protein